MSHSVICIKTLVQSFKICAFTVLNSIKITVAREKLFLSESAIKCYYNSQIAVWFFSLIVCTWLRIILFFTALSLQQSLMQKRVKRQKNDRFNPPPNCKINRNCYSIWTCSAYTDSITHSIYSTDFTKDRVNVSLRCSPSFRGSPFMLLYESFVSPLEEF